MRYLNNKFDFYIITYIISVLIYFNKLKNMNIKPLSDRVVLKAIETQNTTSSGIYIPESSKKERPFIYEVIAIWPGKDGKEMPLSLGDRVLSWQYSWDDVKIDGEDFKIVGIDYILAIVE